VVQAGAIDKIRKAAGHQHRRGTGERPAPVRNAGLVGDDPQFVALLREAADRQQKFLPRNP
jgi:hypothetical protein